MPLLPAVRCVVLLIFCKQKEMVLPRSIVGCVMFMVREIGVGNLGRGIQLCTMKRKNGHYLIVTDKLVQKVNQVICYKHCDVISELYVNFHKYQGHLCMNFKWTVFPQVLYKLDTKAND